MSRFPRLAARTPLMIVVVAAMLVAACSDTPEGAPAGSSGGSAGGVSRSSPGSPTIESGIVGTWEREIRCEELVTVLTDAGLEQWVLDLVAGNGFVPGVTTPDEIANPAEPCDGAVPRTHSHVFTEDGLFGSLDWNGEQVDDGTYEVVGDDTLVVSKEFPDVTFHFAIDGDTITFDPVIPECAPECFEAAWSVSVAYPGAVWHRAGSEEPAGTQVDPLVGEWARTLWCPELLAAFKEAGLQSYVPDMVWGSFFWPEPENIEDFVFDAKDPCDGAEPRLHSHFFTAEGEIGSRDENGQEVDFGSYEIVGKHRLMINDVLFRYRIRGDALMFDPVVPDCTPCFEHAWAVSVASPGGEWDRVAS